MGKYIVRAQSYNYSHSPSGRKDPNFGAVDYEIKANSKDEAEEKVFVEKLHNRGRIVSVKEV